MSNFVKVANATAALQKRHNYAETVDKKVFWKKKNVELAKFFFLWPSANIIKWHD